jgi:hypothetical protein
MCEVWVYSAIDAIRTSYPVKLVEEALSTAQSEEFKQAVLRKAHPVEHVRKEFNQLAPTRSQEQPLVAFDLTTAPGASPEFIESERKLAEERKTAGLPPERVNVPRQPRS